MVPWKSIIQKNPLIRCNKILSLVFLIFLTSALEAQTNSVLNSGQWFKYAVESNGFYKIDYDLLKISGVNPDRIDPRKIKIYTGQSGMLPQSNSESRIDDLSEVAIFVFGEDDGRFNKSDYILFYGQGPDKSYLDPTSQAPFYEYNLYSRQNFYFLTVSTTSGTRVSIAETEGGSFPVINTFDDYAFHKRRDHNILKSGRQWFGEQFDFTTEEQFNITMPGVVENSTIKIISRTMAQSFNGSSFKLFLNSTAVGEQIIPTIPNTQYGIKGQTKSDTFLINSNASSASSRISQELKYQYIKNATGKSVGFLDFWLASFNRKLAYYNVQTGFSSFASLTNSISLFEIDAQVSDLILWDVTDPYATKIQAYTLSSIISFSTNTSSLKRFHMGRLKDIGPPKPIGSISNQNIHNNPTPELLIVVHPNFMEDAKRLADHRQTQSGLSVLVVTTSEVYNEFSGGKQDVTAIRDLVRYFYNRPGSQLKHLLLFGSGSYDYHTPTNNSNYVPVYESRNSLSPLSTYSSDDYYGLLDDLDGNWGESPAENSIIDIGVGRLPVKSSAEANLVVDKLIAYDTNKKAIGSWRKKILFVADDGDFNIHQSQADQLAGDIEMFYPQIDTRKIYLDAFPQESKASGQTSPEATKALKREIDKGILIVNFTGHGSEQVWMQELVLDAKSPENWSNSYYHPLFVTATCEFGRHDDPNQNATGIVILTQSKEGAIGLITSSRPVSSSTNFFLNRALYLAMFEKINNQYKDLGTIFRDTKNNSINGISNRNFVLLGDPSMHLALPELEIMVDNISTVAGSDTLKALSHVRVIGSVLINGNVHDSYNGTLEVTLFDKEKQIQTLGDENPPFNFREWSSALFRGKASVINGLFQTEFIVPANIDFTVGNGKLSMYVNSENDRQEGAGAQLNFLIGDVEDQFITDNTSPFIELFMGDNTFIEGGLVTSNTKLVAILEDASGLNISSSVLENEMTAILDDSVTFVISEYYVAEKDTYQKGRLEFPLENLAPGMHTITLKAWDVHNNMGIASLQFVVSETDHLQIEELKNYPNPFSLSTTIQFTHNRSGEDLELALTFFTFTGQTAGEFDYRINSSPYRVTLMEWDGTLQNGAKLAPGLYLMRVNVRSLQDGSKNEQMGKLIITN